MASLTTLELGVDRETLLDVMNRDGGAILRSAIAPETVKQMYDEVMPYVEVTPMGRDDFSGRETQRTGALVARSPTCRDLVLHDQVFEAAKGFLAPYAERVLLHLTQIIRIHPGQGAQMLHRDRLAWGTHLPRSIEPQFNTLWALTDFTAENGATRLVPGSQTWNWERRAEADEICHAEMSAGSVLLYTGSIIHGGGENQSGLPRMGLNISYTLGWLRQEENQYLSCPPRIARDLAPELQELLGYTQGNYALGYFSEPDGPSGKADLLPPEMALGRVPRKGKRFTATDFSD